MANANVNMSVSGIQQFKRDIGTAESSVRTLNAEMKLAEAQYKQTGDQEAYMRAKTELLKKKIEEQQKAVDAAEKALKTMTENGVDPSSRAFQSMKEKLASAKANLLDTKTQLDNVGTASGEAETKTGELNTQLESVAKHANYDAVIEGIGKITSGIGIFGALNIDITHSSFFSIYHCIVGKLIFFLQSDIGLDMCDRKSKGECCIFVTGKVIDNQMIGGEFKAVFIDCSKNQRDTA